MNGVGDRCKAVLLLVEDSVPLDDTVAQHSRGYHCACACALPPGTTTRPTREDCVRLIKERTAAFCAANGLKVHVMEAEDVKQWMVAPDDGSALASISSPLTVVTCSGTEMSTLRARLLSGLAPADGAKGATTSSPYCLVAVMDATRHRMTAVGEEERGGKSEEGGLGWLRPTQSYVSEYRRDGLPDGTAIVHFPLHMYCTMPMIRDTGFGGSEEDLLAGDNVCTLEGILRELGYKAGQLPKYGA